MIKLNEKCYQDNLRVSSKSQIYLQSSLLINNKMYAVLSERSHFQIEMRKNLVKKKK